LASVQSTPYSNILEWVVLILVVAKIFATPKLKTLVVGISSRFSTWRIQGARRIWMPLLVELEAYPDRCRGIFLKINMFYI